MASRPVSGVSPQPATTGGGGGGSHDANTTTTAGVQHRSEPDPNANGSLLYHQTIIPTQGISHTVRGSFTLPGSNDVLLVRHNVLELWTLHMESTNSNNRNSKNSGGGGGAQAECVHSCPLFTNVLAAAAVPTGLGGAAVTGDGSGGATGAAAAGGAPTATAAAAAATTASALFAAGSGGYDYLIITSDTGYATLLRYELNKAPVPTRTAFLNNSNNSTGGGGSSSTGSNDNSGSTTTTTTTTTTTGTFIAPSLRGRFVKVSEVCLGRSGTRPTVPGARIAVDPRGESIIITALMRSKVVIPIRRTDFGTIVNNSTASGRRATSTSSSPTMASSLGWLGVGSTNLDGGAADDDDDDDNINDDEEKSNYNVLGRRAAGGDDSEVLARRLQRRKRRLAAPRGLLALGSPIEAHRQTVIFSACALEGFLDTSVFAVLEQNTIEAAAAAATDNDNDGSTSDNNTTTTTSDEGSHKYLVIYAYLPSLQQVQRTHLVRVPGTAHRLVPVPAGQFGPGGVLVCTDTELIWYDLSPSAVARTTSHQHNNSSSVAVPSSAAGGVFKCTAPLPRRMAFVDGRYDPSIIAHTSTCVRRDFFLLLQDEHGDLFRVFLSSANVQRAYDALKAAETLRLLSQNNIATPAMANAAPPKVVNPLAVHYFDSIPPVTGMALFDKGLLLAASESGPFHGLYRVIRDGYSKEAEYVEKRVRHVRETMMMSQPIVDVKRPRENDESSPSSSGAKKEEDEEADLAKPKATGKLLAMLPPAPAASTTTTTTRVIALFQPHRGLKHMALVQTYPNTPPIVSFTTSIPSNNSGQSSSSMPAPPTTLATASSSSAATATSSSSSQPQMQFNIIAGRGSGSLLLSARFGYATRREAQFVLPLSSSSSSMTSTTATGGASNHTATAEGVLALLSASSLQRLMRGLEESVAQAQRLANAAATVAAAASTLGGGDTDNNAISHEKKNSAATASRLKALQRLVATSGGGGRSAQQHLWTDTLLITTSAGTTVPCRVGRTVEVDWWTGFVTTERTLAAATLRHGVGFAQVTQRGIYILSPVSKEDRERERGNNSGGGGSTVGDAHPSSPSSSASGLVEPANWVHRHGKLILAAAATPRSLLVTFAQGGGLASFSFGLAGTRLEQSDELPTFPPATAVSLLQPSADYLTGSAMNAQLNTFLFGDGANTNNKDSTKKMNVHASGDGGDGVDEMELAAVATISQEVHIVNPNKLRETIEKIDCKRGKNKSKNEEATSGGGGESDSNAIVSVLLTHLGGTDASSHRKSGGGATATTTTARCRLFCFIGHMNGLLTRCELDPFTARLLERDELTCGTAPCKIIPGDAGGGGAGGSVCYVQSGANAWRCEIRDGVPKVVPWRFPQRQTAFASFLRPLAGAMSNSSNSNGDEKSKSSTASIPATTTTVKREKQRYTDEEVGGEHDDDDDNNEEEEEGGGGEASGGGVTFTAPGSNNTGGGGSLAREECVVAVAAGNLLSLFSAHRTGSGASALEYSFTAQSLPAAGRRLLRHPTRPAYHVVLSTEHRGYSRAEVQRTREEQLRLAKIASIANGNNVSPSSSVLSGAIPVDAPLRALGIADRYSSTIQLAHEDSGVGGGGGGNRVLPRYFLPEGEAIMCGAIGSFTESFGKEPVLVVGAASRYTHGAGCGVGPSWDQGWLCAFRFTTQQQAGAAVLGNEEQHHQQQQLRIEAIHRTRIRPDTDPSTGLSFPDDYPSAVHVCDDVGLLFVGLGPNHGLRIYVWGQQQLLRKRHLPGFPSRIVAIQTAWLAPPPGSATTSTTANFISDLYQVPYSNPEALRRAREQRLLIFCATASHSVVVASLLSGAGSGGTNINSSNAATTTSFLMIVGRDAVPRSLTSALVVLRDGRTCAVADRFGNVAFLRLPLNARTGFSLPVAALKDGELAQAEEYISQEQMLEETACHQTGQLVTALQTQYYDPSNGADAAGLAVELIVYGTALGAVGAYTPFIAEEDAALAAHVQPILRAKMRGLLSPQSGGQLPANVAGGLTATAGTAATHHVIEGDVLRVFRQSSSSSSSSGGGPSSSSVFTTAAKLEVEEELSRAKKVEGARRRVLGLPVRELPELADLIAKQRALASLPQ